MNSYGVDSSGWQTPGFAREPIGFDRLAECSRQNRAHFHRPRGTSLFGVLNILVRPALQELGMIIIAPDSIAGAWTTPENDLAVNTIEGVLNS